MFSDFTNPYKKIKETPQHKHPYYKKAIKNLPEESKEIVEKISLLDMPSKHSHNFHFHNESDDERMKRLKHESQKISDNYMKWHWEDKAKKNEDWAKNHGWELINESPTVNHPKDNRNWFRKKLSHLVDHFKKPNHKPTHHQHEHTKEIQYKSISLPGEKREATENRLGPEYMFTNASGRPNHKLIEEFQASPTPSRDMPYRKVIKQVTPRILHKHQNAHHHNINHNEKPSTSIPLIEDIEFHHHKSHHLTASERIGKKIDWLDKKIKSTLNIKPRKPVSETSNILGRHKPHESQMNKFVGSTLPEKSLAEKHKEHHHLIRDNPYSDEIMNRNNDFYSNVVNQIKRNRISKDILMKWTKEGVSDNIVKQYISAYVPHDVIMQAIKDLSEEQSNNLIEENILEHQMHHNPHYVGGLKHMFVKHEK